MKALQAFMQDEAGVTMIEYGLIAGLIAVVCVVAIQAVGANLNIVFGKVRDCLANPANCA